MSMLTDSFRVIGYLIINYNKMMRIDKVKKLMKSILRNKKNFYL